MQYRARPNIVVYAADHHREFVLARLQKAQCYPGAANYPRQLAAAIGLAQPAFGDFSQQEIAENADPLRGAQLLGIDEIGFLRRSGQLGQTPYQAVWVSCTES